MFVNIYAREFCGRFMIFFSSVCSSKNSILGTQKGEIFVVNFRLKI